MMIRNVWLQGMILLLTIGYIGAEPLVVHVDPPRIDDADSVTHYASNRPWHENGIQITCEQVDDKTIVHNYGHGGYGYTTLFGSVATAISLFLETQPSTDLPIAIIGVGCIGLTTALELYQRGFRHITLYADETHNIPSWYAGGFFDPGTGDEKSDADCLRCQLGMHTFTVLRDIKEGLHPYLDTDTVCQLPIYHPAHKCIGVEILERDGLMPAHEEVTLDYGNGVRHEGYVRSYTYFIHVTHLMNQLWARVRARSILVVNRQIAAFADCPQSVIFNATGLGSLTLNNDTHLVPKRGHFMMLKPQLDAHSLEYMLLTTVMQNDKEETIYLFPKNKFMPADGIECHECAAMIGGTFIPVGSCDEEMIKQIDAYESATLYERVMQFFFPHQVLR